MRFRCLLISFATLLAGCSSGEVKIRPTEVSNATRSSNRGVAVAQIELSFNKTSNAAFSSLLDSLKRRNIGVAGTNENEGQIQTKWTPVTDHLCENGVKSFAPLQCRVRFHFEIHPATRAATKMKGLYQELCSFGQEVRVECPGSNAEQMLKDITEESANGR